MIKIDFNNFQLFTDIAHKKSEMVNIRQELAERIYSYGTGIAFYALALKIYNSTQETELDEKEVALLLEFVNLGCSPNVIDSLNVAINEAKDKLKE